MKKFTFSLEKLMEYKEQLLNKEKTSLGLLRQQKHECEIQREEFLVSKHQKCLEYNKQMQQGLSPWKIAIHKNYIESIDQKIFNVQTKIHTFDSNIQKQLDVVINITKEINSIERLKEKQLDEYKKQESKQQELFIEEFVSHQSYSTI